MAFVGESGYKRRVMTNSSSPMRTATARVVALFLSAPFDHEFPALQYWSVRIPSSESSMPEVSWAAIPVVGPGHTLGRFLVDLPGDGMRTDPASRGLAVASADQLGAVLARSEGSSMQGGRNG